MTFKEIQELIKLVNKMNLTEFKMKDGDFELSVRTEKYNKTKTTQAVPPQQQIVPVTSPSVSPAPSPAAPAAPETTPVSEPDKPKAKTSPEDSGKYLEVKSPIVGTFYRSSSPEKEPYVKIGDTIEKGQVVCIVEAMKLFNEIESEVSGKIVKVLVEDATPIEYDQVLFLVDPS